MKTVKERVLETIEFNLGLAAGEAKPEWTLEYLGMDSLDYVEIIMAMEDEFEREVSDPVAGKWNSIQDIIDYFESKEK